MLVSLADKLPLPLRHVLPQTPSPVYLVGGALRDLLLGRPVRDWDVLAADAEGLAQALARACSTRVVVLHRHPLTARVPCSGSIVDIVQSPPEGIEGDLARRDFTINALALPLSGGGASGEILDLFGGLRDLRAGLLRTVGPHSLAADPVRVVRAYRLMAELGMRPSRATAKALRQQGPLAEQAHPQRLGAEILRLLDTPLSAAPTLRRMKSDGLIALLLPWAEAMSEVGRGGFHHLPVLGHTLEALAYSDRLLAAPRLLFRTSGQTLEKALGRPFARCRLRAAVLLHDVGKPAAHQRRPDGGVSYYGHEEIGATQVRALMRRWAWPRDVASSVEHLVRLHMRPLTLARGAVEREEAITDRALRHLARDAGDDLPLLFLLAAADLLAARGPASDSWAKALLLDTLDEMLRRSSQRPEAPARPRLLTGHDLMRELGLPPGPRLGRVLRAVEEAHDEGRLVTRQEALELARAIAARLGVTKESGDEEASADAD